ncbi:MAG: hypothetical protein OXG35_33915 [Acidobacteria bacterium]|nr:hypothetical protein [Acidobacteriota bacterium]
MLLVDTTELIPHTQRQLHAAWHELQGNQLCSPPTVAFELAPRAINTLKTGEASNAEDELRKNSHRYSAQELRYLRSEAWWAKEWRNSESPYRIVQLTEKQEEQAAKIRTVIPARCFPGTPPEDIPELRDARIVTESLVLNAKMLLTSNLNTIDRVELNNWATTHGSKWGVPAEDFIFDADDQMVKWSRSPEGLTRLVQAGLLACWPTDDRLDPREIALLTRDKINRMRSGSGGKLKDCAERLINGLDKHPDPVTLVERTRALQLPSPTVEAERRHPSYPVRGADLPTGGHPTTDTREPGRIPGR